MGLRLYNTESRQKEEIVSRGRKPLCLYTCGPTVYNFAHIGNFRTYVFEDLLRRSLLFFGFHVKQVMNLTDVDDKTIRGATELGVSLEEFTRPYIDAFFEDLDTLNIQRVEHYPAATEYIAEMITLIQGLMDKGVAYRGQEGSIYFAIDRFPSYGRLSHLQMEDLKAGASQAVSLDEYEKENACDFVLWKAYDPARDGKIYWESPFGPGRPGWHTECSAMALKLLGESVDIHVGGVDNIFPHHENEIAQSESFSCCRFVRYWLHAEHLLVDHKKMSKSLGNFYTLRDLVKKGYSGKEVRYLLLQTHYRTQLNFTFAGLEAARTVRQRFADFIRRLEEIHKDRLVKVLDLILDKALPEGPHRKEIQQRILKEVRLTKANGILKPDQLRPVLDKALAQELAGNSGHIIGAFNEESKRILLGPIIARGFPDPQAASKVLSQLVHAVSKEEDHDILDPEFMQPLLAKTLQGNPKEVDKIVHSMKEKRNSGLIFPLVRKALEEFATHLGDDLNVSPAFATLFDFMREVNVFCDQGKVGAQEAEEVLYFLRKVDEVLGVLPFGEEEIIPASLQQALEEREKARKAKNWEAADLCRAKIYEAGYLIEDTPTGAHLKRRDT